MDKRAEFEAIMLKKGFDAAVLEKARVLAKVESDFRQALKNITARMLEKADAPTGTTPTELTYGVLTNWKCVLAILRDHGGKMKSRELYSAAEKAGKSRQTIYVTVSKLIREGSLIKDPLPGERGCILRLVKRQ